MATGRLGLLDLPVYRLIGFSRVWTRFSIGSGSRFSLDLDILVFLDLDFSVLGLRTTGSVSLDLDFCAIA
jgi:hypothetical protein